MKKIKQASCNGIFYPETEENLKDLITQFRSENDYSVVPPGFSTRAVIAPHAGLNYSGSIAFKAIDYFNRNVKTIFIIATAHRVYFKGIALSSYELWETPFGQVEIDGIKNLELLKRFDAKYNDDAFKDEHSIEVLLPLIQKLLGDVKIVPILIGKENPITIKKIIESFYFNSNNGFIISSDLSHFLSDKEAREKDVNTANLIEAGKSNIITCDMACGFYGISGMSLFASENKFSLIRIGMQNSSVVTGDTSRVVGYGAWALFEGLKNEFIFRYYSDFILELCKTAIKSTFSKEAVQIKYHKVFDEMGASFVTLEDNGVLRGCIGTIKPYRNLILDLISNARNAAYKDPRFSAVREGEADNLKISVSLLNEPVKMHFTDEKDLLNQIEQYKDGLIIKEGSKQAVYLPSVWDNMRSKKEFLSSLKMKAELPPDYFSKTLEVYKFQTICIQ